MTAFNTKLATLLLYFSIVSTVSAQGPVLTEADYARAESKLLYNTSQLVDRTSVRASWLPGDRFWYRVLTESGSEFILVDPLQAKRSPAFDHSKLAGDMTRTFGTAFNASRLPFSVIHIENDGNIKFPLSGKNWKYNPKTRSLSADTSPLLLPSTKPTVKPDTVLSPNGKLAAFIRGYNLWMRDITTKKEVQLTTDGQKDFGYSTDNAGWRKSNRPILSWSPDSKKIATYQQDQRKVSDMYLVTTNVGKPILQSWKYPLPGDEIITAIHRVIIEVNKPKVIRLKLPPDPRRSTLCDDISCGGKDFGDVDWNADGSRLAFVSTSRDHRQNTLWIADAATGAIREVLKENVATQFESGQGSINWRFLFSSNEILWFSERSNWGHLYLFDATTGKLKNAVTSGNWAISELLKVDEKTRTVYFLAGGKEAGQNPYFTKLYKARFDGTGLTLLTPEDGNHEVEFSPSAQYFTDTYSRQDVPPVTVLRQSSGKMILELEKSNISRLTASGWKPPIPIVVKARDGVTDLYGLMFTPSNLDLNKKYPVINYIYPGPQGGSIKSWSFETATGDNQALAELGFIVVSIEGTCNPLRSKSFHDMCYGNMADNTLPDQIAGMKELAKKYPYIDIDKAGIWGHSGGGYATAAAMFRFPEFFKVGISESGNHDNRNYEDDWGERYIGLLETGADGQSNYEAQANQNYAKNLQGKLMLAHGMLDENVPPYNTLLVVEALNKANKDYDLVIFPNSRHGYGNFGPYMMRRRWDFFVRNLLGGTPPKEYELKTKTDPRNEGLEK